MRGVSEGSATPRAWRNGTDSSESSWQVARQYSHIYFDVFKVMLQLSLWSEATKRAQGWARQVYLARSQLYRTAAALLHPVINIALFVSATTSP
jgi:hypothetical protein